MKAGSSIIRRMSTHGRLADLILVNGKITIGDVDATECEALAIHDDRILAVGANDEMQGLAHDKTVVVDLGGRRVIPGLIDSHIHLMRAGLTWNDELQWAGVSSLSDALTLIAAAAARLPAGEWIRVVGGWHPGQFAEKRGPTPDELNRVAPHNPVYVQMLYEEAFLNATGLKACGITADMLDPPGASFERDPDTREPTGRMQGLAAFNYCLGMIGGATFERQLASTRSLFNEFNRLGLTCTIDPGGFGATPETYSALFELWRRGEMSVRTRLYVGATQPGQEQEQIREWIRHLCPGFGDSWLKIVGVGEIVVFGCHDLEGLTPVDVSDESKATLLDITRMVAQRGWPMHIHAVLDSSVSAILDVWEQINHEIPLAGRRFSIAHADAISEANLLRVQALGLGIAVQDRLVFRAADSARLWGQEVVRNAPPLRRLLELGIPVGAGTDATRVAPCNPWLSLWWLVTGGALDGSPPRHEKHRLSRMEALRLYTTGSAWFSFDEDVQGTLEPGKLADLAVLSADYFNVAEEEIPALESCLTLVGGRPVYASAAFTGIEV